MGMKKSEMNPAPTYGLGGAPACRKLITIRITPAGIKNHRQPAMPGDCIQWKDQTGQSRTLAFQSWPFTETKQLINVPANGYSNTFHVANVPYGSYPYIPDPPAPVGPPNPPEVVVGG